MTCIAILEFRLHTVHKWVINAGACIYQSEFQVLVFCCLLYHYKNCIIGTLGQYVALRLIHIKESAKDVGQ